MNTTFCKETQKDILTSLAKEYLKLSQETSQGNLNFIFNKRGESLSSKSHINCGNKITCLCFPTTCYYAYTKLGKFMVAYMTQCCDKIFFEKKRSVVVFTSGLAENLNPLRACLKHMTYPEIFINHWLHSVQFCVVVSWDYNVTFVPIRSGYWGCVEYVLPTAEESCT